MKRVICLLLMLCTLLPLGGCARSSERASVPQATLPPARAAAAPRGESAMSYLASVPLYLPSLDGERLIAQYTELELSRSVHSAEKVARALLAHPGNDQVTPLGGSVNVTLYGRNPVEVAGGVCTVNLASSALRLSYQQFYTVCVGLATTLCQLDGVRYVNVLVADQPVGLDIAGNLPTGTLTAQPGEVLFTLWEQMDARRTPLGRDAAQTPLNAAATLYFPLADGSGFMPEVRNISFSGQTPSALASGLLTALSSGPQYLEGACEMPNLTALLASAPEASELSDGSRMITLCFTAELENRLALMGIEPACLTGALAYTLTTFIPSVTAVRIMSGSTLMTILYSRAFGALTFPNGVQRRSQYASALMEQAQVYFVRDGRLAPTRRSVPCGDASDLRTLLALLMAGPTEEEQANGFSAALPAGFDRSDVIGVAIENDTVLVNLSERFGQAVQRQEMDEQLLCYSMVTTLCEAENVRRARFFFAGDMMESMGGRLSWSGEFMQTNAFLNDQ